ncbi:MAG: flagellar basal body P-ring protein FlgI [Planctomycetota bacterium]|jgi:flagellar P-ring protein precursor FlgI|nr:flagellar basal body P-ring protein FlgI [Planctomycetota bacterium]
MSFWPRLLVILVLGVLLPGVVRAEAVRELVTIQGAPAIQLEGFGIVTGLAGTGDKKDAALEMLRRYLSNLGQDFDTKNLALGNIAIVRVTAEMSPFARPGKVFPVSVTSIGDAKNLAGGELLGCDLIGGDGELYARATGQVVVGTNVQTRGIIPAGESSGAKLLAPYPFGKVVSDDGFIRLNLNRANYADAVAIARQINQTPSLNPYFQESTMFAEEAPTQLVAWAKDAVQVLVKIPSEHMFDQSRYIAQVLAVPVAVDRPARIVVNRSQNSIVVTGDVRVNNAVVSLQNKTVTIQPEQDDQPATYTLGDDTPRSLVEMDGPGSFADLQGLIDTLNSMGLKTEEIITIFEQLRQAGAINAEFIGQ